MSVSLQGFKSFKQKNTQNQRICQIQCVFQNLLSKKKGNIYISNYQAASNIKMLKEYNINAVLSYAIGTLLPHTKQQIPNYLYVPAEDVEQYQIKNDYELVYEFIEKNRNKTNVLIHCVSGKSRGTAILVFYLMKKYNYSCSQALDMIKRLKSNVKPNVGFLKQLNKFNFELYGSQDKKISQLIKKMNITKQIKTDKNNEQKLTNQIKQKFLQESTLMVDDSNTSSNMLRISPQKCKSLSLIVEKLKIQNQKIQDRILQVKKTIENHQNRKRTKSQYLRQRLEQARQKSLKKGDIISPTNKNQQKFTFSQVNRSKKEIKYKNSPSYRIDILNKKYGMELQNSGIQKKLLF